MLVPVDHSPLFAPFKLGAFTLKNRLGVAPMTRCSSPADSIPRQDVLDFLVRRARNEAALVYTEAIVTDYESAQGYPRQARLVTQKQIDAWAPVVSAMKKAGAVTIMQMFHCGRVSWPAVNPAGRTLAPSAIAVTRPNRFTNSAYPVPEAMSVFDIEHVILGFAETAKGAIAAGFDGVEIHGAHGYLICEFLSGAVNQRTDGYGGSIDKRFRFAREVISAVRPHVPSNRLLTFRISNWGGADPGLSFYESATEWQEVIKRLSHEKLDALSISTMNYKDTAFGTSKCMAELTREATRLPLFICGSIYDRATAEDALKHADVVLSAKSMLLNPNWVSDVRAGKPLSPFTDKDAAAAYTDTPLP